MTDGSTCELWSAAAIFHGTLRVGTGTFEQIRMLLRRSVAKATPFPAMAQQRDVHRPNHDGSMRRRRRSLLRLRREPGAARVVLLRRLRSSIDCTGLTLPLHPAGPTARSAPPLEAASRHALNLSIPGRSAPLSRSATGPRSVACSRAHTAAGSFVSPATDGWRHCSWSSEDATGRTRWLLCRASPSHRVAAIRTAAAGQQHCLPPEGSRGNLRPHKA